MSFIKHQEFSQMINSLYNIPQKITNEWMDEMFSEATDENGRRLSETFANYGVCYRDLSKCDLSKLDEKHFYELAFNSSTSFPSADKMPKGYCPSDILEFGKNPMFDIKKLHKEGIDGSGVCVATIDFGFQDVDHIEFKGSDIEIIDLFGDTGSHFHPDGVLSNLCGQNIGVAPKVKVYHYNTYMGSGEEVDKATLTILKDILGKVQNNIKIRAVNMSGPLLRNKKLNKASNEQERQKLEEVLSAPLLEIIDKLQQLGCEVVTSNRFSQDFSCCDIDFVNKKFIKPAFYKRQDYIEKVSFISGGKVIPEFASESGYKYEPKGCYSWSIPQAVGMYALALQVNENLTWDNFARLCRETSTLKDDVRLVNPEGIIEKVRQKDLKNEQTFQ